MEEYLKKDKTILIEINRKKKTLLNKGILSLKVFHDITRGPCLITR